MAPESPLTRRNVLCGLAAAVLVPTALAACSSDTPESAAPSGSGSAGDGGSAGSSGALTPLADVPVGGGVVVQGPDGPVVVVQPTAGQVAAFTAVCTHQGTTVAAPVDGVMTCPNHGSQFAADSGEVRRGPAEAPLAPISVAVEGDQVVLA